MAYLGLGNEPKAQLILFLNQISLEVTFCVHSDFNFGFKHTQTSTWANRYTALLTELLTRIL